MIRDQAYAVLSLMLCLALGAMIINFNKACFRYDQVATTLIILSLGVFKDMKIVFIASLSDLHL